MFLVDSSVWIDYFNGVGTRASDFLDAELGSQPVLVGELILSEVLQGFRSDREYSLAKNALLGFSVVELGGKRNALRAAESFRALRKRGITPRGTLDCLIAAFCIEQDIPLLHSDKDFLPFQRYLGLRTAL